jgi:glycosyltransferase involved in cell wall biosynthesis
MEKVSIILITLNEEQNIERCLKSVRWADEIVVVDSGSTDRTVELAKKYTDSVHVHPFRGDSMQREVGVGHATGDWIFILDADEEVSSELAEEVLHIAREGTHSRESIVGYEYPRKPSAFGKWIEHGGWYPDYQFRFFRKDSYVANHREVHGGFETHGRKGRLIGIVYHHTYDTVFDYIERLNVYSSLYVSSKLGVEPNIQARWHNLILNPLSHFLRMFFSKKGYRDGFHGFVLAILDAVFSFAVYAKIWEYRMRQKEGKGLLPPITRAELNRRKRTGWASTEG